MSRAERWLQRLLDSNHGLAWLGVFSSLETLIIPVPIELVMVPYMLARPQRIWLIAGVTMLGCVLASIVGYAVGFFLFDSIGQWLLGTLGAQDSYDSFRQRFEDNGFVAILAIGITPVPFQVALLTAGIAGYSLPLFLAAVTLARGLRYFGLALLVSLFGERALALWKKNSLAVGVTVLAVIVAILVATKLTGN